MNENLLETYSEFTTEFISSFLHCTEEAKKEIDNSGEYPAAPFDYFLEWSAIDALIVMIQMPADPVPILKIAVGSKIHRKFIDATISSDCIGKNVLRTAKKLYLKGDLLLGENQLGGSPENLTELLQFENTLLGAIPQIIYSVPIFSGSHLIGSITAYNFQQTPYFLPGVSNAVDFMASFIGPHIYADYLEEIVNQNIDGATKIIDISNIVNSKKEIGHLLQEIISSARVVLGVEEGSVLLLNAEKTELHFEVVTNINKDLKSIVIPVTKGVAGKVVRTGEGAIINTTFNETDFFKGVDEQTDYKTRNLIAVPMKVQNEIIGVLEVVNSKRKQYFDKRDLQIVQSFADKISMAIFNRSLIDDLETANKNLQSSLNEVRAMYEISRQLKKEDSIKNVAPLAISILAQTYELEIVTILLYNERSKMLETAGAICPDNSLFTNLSLNVNDTICGNVFTTTKAVLQEVINEPYSFYGERVEKTFIVVPLISNGKSIGVINLIKKKSNEPFTRNDFTSFRSIAIQIGKTLESVFFYNEYLQKQEMEQEIQLTRTLQKSVLPVSFCPSEIIDVSAANIPAKEVCGDFYDYFAMTDGLYGFVIADVSGKGLPAGLFMALSRSIFRAEAQIFVFPEKTVSKANELITRDSQDAMFVTLFYVLVNSRSKKLRYCSAGHDQQILYHVKTDSFTFLKTKGPPLGVIETATYLEESCSYETDDILILYTDGVPESFNSSNEPFGFEKITQSVRKTYKKSSIEIQKQLLKELTDYCGDAPQFDDITLMVLKLR